VHRRSRQLHLHAFRARRAWFGGGQGVYLSQAVPQAVAGHRRCMVKGKVVAVCISEEKGTRKVNVGTAYARENWGFEGDAHAGHWHRQVSLLGVESIQKALDRGLEVGPGDFAENVTTEGLCLVGVPIGSRLRLGEALVEVTQIGKDPQEHSVIHDLLGDSLIPREGIFVRVLEGGMVSVGDEIEVILGSDPEPME